MKQLETVWLVYRSHYEGGLSKRSVRLPGSSVLDWFRHAWRETLSLEEDAIEKWVESECAGYIYGLSSIFTAAKENGLPPPNSWSELIAYLNEYLYVEGEIVLAVKKPVMKHKPHISSSKLQFRAARFIGGLL